MVYKSIIKKILNLFYQYYQYKSFFYDMIFFNFSFFIYALFMSIENIIC